MIAERADAARARRFDEFLLLDGERLAAHDPRHGQPFHRADGDEQQDEVAVEDHHQDDDEEDEGQRIEHIDEAHHQSRRCAPPTIARDRAIEHADHQADQGRDQADRQRNPRAIKHAHEQIAADRIGAEPVRAAGVAEHGLVRPPVRRAGHDVRNPGIVKTVWRQQRREDRHQRDDRRE